MIERTPEEFRVEILYRQSLIANIMGLVNAKIFCYVSGDFINQMELLKWFGVVFVIYAARFSYQLWFNKKYIKGGLPFDPRFFENKFAIGAFLIGLCWAYAGTVFLIPGAISQHAFLAFMLAGTTAGAAVAYCISLRSIWSFLLPSIVPFAIAVAMEGDKVHYAMSALSFSYVAVLSISMTKVNKAVVKSIMLRFEKDQLLKELHRTQNHVLHSSKMAALGEMAGGIAHEINNPLSIILLNSEKIRIMADQKSFDEKAVFDSTDKIESTVHRMAKIIKGLKFFAQEESQDVRHNVSVQSIVDDTLMFCRRRFEENKIQLEIMPIPSDFSLNCNSVQISHVLLNLFNNAFEAVSTVPNGVVKLEVSGNANQIIFSITDNGKGIPAEIRDKIMQPFFTTKEIGAGPGLGLSITFGIVDLYGGNLTLKPLDQGSCFVVTLPRMAIAA